MMNAVDQEQAERERRQRVLKGGSILLGINRSEIGCAIRNMHENGAELRVSADQNIPVEFLLYVPIDGIAYRCVQRWRAGDRIGVQFTGTAPKPHWHYG